MERERRSIAEKSGNFLKRAGIVGAVIGLVAMIASIKIGETLFVGGAAVGAAGAVTENAARPKRGRQ
jgi:flagellar motor component MotA